VRHHERHRTAHIGWLRASVLGANDGLISTASLIVGVAAGRPGSGGGAGGWCIDEPRRFPGRVLGALAMTASAVVGRLFGAQIQ
jgi:VIT1/CCC1 family predicted Fe2+/Mn2+ transporter